MLPVYVISAVVLGLIFDAQFFHDGQVKYQVQLDTHLTTVQMDAINRGIVRFFGDSETLPSALAATGADPNVFNEREILHMNDVRGLIQGIGRLAVVSLAFLAVFLVVVAVTWRRGGRRAFARTLTFGAIWTLALGIVTGLLTYFAFDQLFLAFHEISFHNDFWQLDPRTDHLIQMFPYGFWYDAMDLVATRVIVVMLILGACGLLLRRIERPRVGALS